MADVVDLRIVFTLHDDDSGLDFTDALYMTPEEYSALSEADLDAMKQERFQAWKDSVTNAPSPAPIQQDPATQMADIANQMQNLAQQAADIASQSDVPVPVVDTSALEQATRKNVAKAAKSKR